MPGMFDRALFSVVRKRECPELAPRLGPPLRKRKRSTGRCPNPLVVFKTFLDERSRMDMGPLR